MVTNMKLAFTNGPWSSELQEEPKLEVEPDLNGGTSDPSLYHRYYLESNISLVLLIKVFLTNKKCNIVF